MSDETKTCPDCAETIKAAAKVCRFCGHRFEVEQLVEQVGSDSLSDFHTSIALRADAKQDAKQKAEIKRSNIGCGLFAVVGIVFVIWLVIGTGTSDEGDNEQFVSEETKAQLAELQERESGMHCLSSLDGSNRALVTQVKSMLRNPDSFEHVETRITPLDSATGEHGLWMTYRAQNGFGGVNVERMYARVSNATCDARILPDGPGSG